MLVYRDSEIIQYHLKSALYEETYTFLRFIGYCSRPGLAGSDLLYLDRRCLHFVDHTGQLVPQRYTRIGGQCDHCNGEQYLYFELGYEHQYPDADQRDT